MRKFFSRKPILPYYSPLSLDLAMFSFSFARLSKRSTFIFDDKLSMSQNKIGPEGRASGLDSRFPLFIFLGALVLVVGLLHYFREEEKLLPPPTEEELNIQAIRKYIQTYKYLAINEMRRTGIPASITLAQGILESKYGTSELAAKANNHFGIKSGKDWLGARYCVYSNEWNNSRKIMESLLSCFRYYDSVFESFRNHSDFLRDRPRYSKLFRISSSYYAGWAHGLSECGYATDPQYAQKLISLIERFALYNVDVLARQNLAR